MVRITKQEIANILGINITTVSNLVNNFVSKYELVIEDGHT
jgi:DNA-binding CsgD family transcriptional regulator